MFRLRFFGGLESSGRYLKPSNRRGGPTGSNQQTIEQAQSQTFIQSSLIIWPSPGVKFEDLLDGILTSVLDPGTNSSDNQACCRLGNGFVLENCCSKQIHGRKDIVNTGKMCSTRSSESELESSNRKADSGWRSRGKSWATAPSLASAYPPPFP